MADLFDSNRGGATHPGARAIIHSAADSEEHVVRYRVVAEAEEHSTLNDGYTYDKRTGAVRGPAGRPALQHQLTATEGSAMLASRSRTAGASRRQRPHATPSYEGLLRACTAPSRLQEEKGQAKAPL